MSGSLAISPEKIIQALLINLSLGTDPSNDDSWPVYATNEPNIPHNCITTYSTAGQLHGGDNPTGKVREQYGIQIRVRGEDTNTGYTKINAIMVAMDQSVNWNVITLSSHAYQIQRMQRASTILRLGSESPTSDRKVFTVNYLASINQFN